MSISLSTTANPHTLNPSGPDRTEGFQTKETMSRNRTYLAPLALLLLLVPSCLKDEHKDSEDRVPVVFSTYGQRRIATRAGASYVAPGSNFAAGAQISVYGFYHDNCTFATDANNIPDFMYDQLVEKQDDGSWTYSPVKYWPNEYGAGATSDGIDRLSFWGYYPYGATGLNLYRAGTTTAYDNVSTGLPKITFTQQENPDDQIDLMFCVPVKDIYRTMGHDEGGDTWNYGYLTNGEVTLTFKHALSLVEFKLAEGTGAKLNTLSLTNIKKTGTLEDPATTPYVWSGQGSEYTISQNDLDVDEATLLRLLVIPQDISSSATFTLNYDITFASSDPDHPDPIVYKGDSFSVKLYDNTNADPAKQYGVTAWESGHHYIYKISAGLDRIEFEDVVDDTWTSAGSDISVSD